MESVVFNKSGTGQGVMPGEITVQMAQDLRIISSKPRDMTEYLILCGKMIQDRSASHPAGLSEPFKFKFLIETSRQLGLQFQIDRMYNGDQGLITSRSEFYDLIKITDTWEEPWLRVIRRHIHVNDILTGQYPETKKEPIPYYGFNPVIQNSISILQ